VIAAASVVLLGGGRMPQPTLELLAPSTARAGDTIEVVLRIRNDGPRPMEIELSGRPVGFDIVIETADGTEIWRRLAKGTVGAALMLVTLRPGESRDFAESWSQEDRNGRRVAPGRYRIRGILPMGQRELVTRPHELVIQP
jgi:hypothetical protein